MRGLSWGDSASDLAPVSHEDLLEGNVPGLSVTPNAPAGGQDLGFKI
jgi:hypothetical protein